MSSPYTVVKWASEWMSDLHCIAFLGVLQGPSLLPVSCLDEMGTDYQDKSKARHNKAKAEGRSLSGVITKQCIVLYLDGCIHIYHIDSTHYLLF